MADQTFGPASLHRLGGARHVSPTVASTSGAQIERIDHGRAAALRRRKPESAHLALLLLQHSSVWDVSKEFPELSQATLARMKGHPDKKKLKNGQTVIHQYYRCNRYEVRVGERRECKNQSVIKCSEVDELLLVHVQHTLDRIADIKAAFDKAVRAGQTDSRGPALRARLSTVERKRDRLVERVADGRLEDEEAQPKS